jgi:hypothetical protein
LENMFYIYLYEYMIMLYLCWVYLSQRRENMWPLPESLICWHKMR